MRNSRVSGELEFPANIESIVIERSEIEKIYCIPNISSMSLIDISLDNLFLKILPANLQKLTLSHIDNVNLDLLPPNLEYLMLEKVTFSEQYKILHRYLPETLKSLDIRNLSNKIIYKIQPNIREILTEDADNLCIIHFHLKKLGKVIKTRNCKYYTKHKVLFMKEIRDSLFYTSGIYTRSICSDMISRYYYITKIKSKLFRYLLDVSIENIYNPYHPNCVILRIFTKT
ncbi:MAG TPA: hypothetical protein V6C58_14075 [Allocoleopsis sp.]